MGKESKCYIVYKLSGDIKCEIPMIGSEYCKRMRYATIALMAVIVCIALLVILLDFFNADFIVSWPIVILCLFLCITLLLALWMYYGVISEYLDYEIAEAKVASASCRKIIEEQAVSSAKNEKQCATTESSDASKKLEQLIADLNNINKSLDLTKSLYKSVDSNREDTNREDVLTKIKKYIETAIKKQCPTNKS